MPTRKVCVILPALNEADALEPALHGRPDTVRTIVVDNGSTDDTADVARSFGAEVVSEPKRGFGAACRAGLMASEGAEIVVFMDADATCRWSDLLALTAPIETGAADLVLGRRVKQLRAKGSMPSHVAAANSLLGKLVSRMANIKVHDIPPYRAVRRQALLDLALVDDTYGWPLEMVLKAGKTGLKVCEVPVHYEVRAGTSKVTGTLKGTVGATRKMLGVLSDYR